MVYFILALVVFGYMAVMHTAPPFRAARSLLESAATNVNLKITGTPLPFPGGECYGKA
jgi:hypothetical protein